MSMAILSALQLAGISAVYFLVILLLPWLFLRKRLAGSGSISERFMIYFLAGNFYIINLVYLLQLLHISCWLTLVLGTLAPFIANAAARHRDSFLKTVEESLVQILLVLGGETGKKTLWLRAGKRLKRFLAATSKKRKDYWKNYGLETLLIFGLTVLLLYMYGSNAVNVYGYCASDSVVHNRWINEMGHNNIFADGVYPFGMHCLLYYIHAVFGFHVSVLIRLFYVIQTMMAHLMLLAFLRSLCKSRYAPYIGIIIYIVSNKFFYYTYIRYCATLPQELGMIFILPAAYFAMAFLREKNLTAGFQRTETKLSVSGLYLILFSVSIYMTLTIHLYDTVIAGLLCISIGVGFCFRVFRWKYFKRIVTAGIAGLFFAALPMAAAFVTGTPLQASLSWGAEQWANTVPTDVQAGSGSMGDDTLGVLDIIVNRMEYYVSYDTETAQVIVGSIGLLFVLGFLWILLRKAEYGAVLLSISVYMAILSAYQASIEFGLFSPLDVTRYSVYLGYGIPVVWSLCVDALLWILFRKVKILNFCSFAALTAACVVTAKTGLRAPVIVSPYETNEAITCLNNIIYENKDEAWTICSANDERQMLGDYDKGYHYELIDFLREMRSYDKDTTITIPTSTVYFFIEKVPILYLDYINMYKPEKVVSLEGAKKPVSEGAGMLPYIGDERWITMSHMYYWAQAFKELYPNEMETYYESDNFVCYRVKQNEYSLYNFAIDYGYNGVARTKKD